MTRLVVLLMLMAVGCQSSTEAPRPAKSSTAAQKADADAKPTLKEQREAFGIALPPDSYDINRAEYTIEATTKLNLSEVEAFYGGKLKEHERLSTRRMREWIPLFEYLPKVTAVQLSSRSPTQLTFELKAPKAEAAEFKDYKPGDPVDFKTPTGELLAPGAIYGEPYTPPPGSPLADKRYRSNWGKPFGTWVPQ